MCKSNGWGGGGLITKVRGQVRLVRRITIKKLSRYEELKRRNKFVERKAQSNRK